MTLNLKENSNPDFYAHDRILTTAEAAKFLGRSRSWLMAKIDPKAPGHDAEFPRPFKMSNRAVSWSLIELREWLESVRVPLRRKRQKRKSGEAA